MTADLGVDDQLREEMCGLPLSPYQARSDRDEAPPSNNPASAAYGLQASHNRLEIRETQIADAIATDIEDTDVMEDAQTVDQREWRACTAGLPSSEVGAVLEEIPTLPMQEVETETKSARAEDRLSLYHGSTFNTIHTARAKQRADDTQSLER